MQHNLLVFRVIRYSMNKHYFTFVELIDDFEIE